MSNRGVDYSKLESQKEQSNNSKLDDLSRKISQFRGINSDIFDQSQRDMNADNGILGQLEERLNQLNQDIMNQSQAFSRILQNGTNRKTLRNAIAILVILIVIYYILKKIF
jgi:protein transport protein SFT1